MLIFFRGDGYLNEKERQRLEAASKENNENDEDPEME